jgi:putative methyltransferase (TIGR04325 family)
LRACGNCETVALSHWRRIAGRNLSELQESTLAVVTQVFPDFAAAAAACGAGYHAAEIADVIAYKTGLAVDVHQFAPEQAINSVLAVGIAASEVTARPLRVLDFGGGCGFHFFRVTASIRTPLRWAIVETPTMTTRAAKLSQGRFDAVSDIAAGVEALGHVDLVHASSSIQYMPEPLAALQSLAALRPRCLALLRFPWWMGPQTVGLQPSTLAGNGIGPLPPGMADREITYPVTFTNFNDVLRTLSDFEIALVVPSPSSIYELRGQKILGISVIFRLKDSH